MRISLETDLSIFNTPRLRVEPARGYVLWSGIKLAVTLWCSGQHSNPWELPVSGSHCFYYHCFIEFKRVLNNYRSNRMMSEKLLDLDLDPPWVVCTGKLEMDANCSDVREWEGSIGCALEECDSEKREGGGMNDWVGSRKKENVLGLREDFAHLWSKIKESVKRNWKLFVY